MLPMIKFEFLRKTENFGERVAAPVTLTSPRPSTAADEVSDDGTDAYSECVRARPPCEDLPHSAS